MAAGPGLEPGQTDSKSAVLPLHNPAKLRYYTIPGALAMQSSHTPVGAEAAPPTRQAVRCFAHTHDPDMTFWHFSRQPMGMQKRCTRHV